MFRKYYYANIKAISTTKKFETIEYTYEESGITNLGKFIVTRTIDGGFREVSTGKRVGLYRSIIASNPFEGILPEQKEGKDYSRLFVDVSTLEEIPKKKLKGILTKYSKRSINSIDSLFTREDLVNGGMPLNKDFCYGRIVELHDGFDDAFLYHALCKNPEDYLDDYGNYMFEKVGKNKYRELLTGQVFGSFNRKSATSWIDGGYFDYVNITPSSEHEAMIVDEPGLIELSCKEVRMLIKRYSSSIDSKTLDEFFKTTEQNIIKREKVIKEEKINSLSFGYKPKSSNK